MNDDPAPTSRSIAIPPGQSVALRGNSLVARGLQDIVRLEGSRTPGSDVQPAERWPVVIQISRQEVAYRDPSRVVNIIKSFIPDLLERNRNRIQLEVVGFAGDPRELYDIPEVRAYFQALREVFPGMFYWLDSAPDGFAFVLMGLMLYTPVRIAGGQVTISPRDLQEYLSSGFTELNTFCKRYDISADASNRSIREWLGGRKS